MMDTEVLADILDSVALEIELEATDIRWHGKDKALTESAVRDLIASSFRKVQNKLMGG